MNFQNFFQLKESPFGETPDVRFFYPSRVHREALQKACWSVEENKAFVLISGAAGSGKTILSRMIYEAYSGEANLAMVVNPVMDRASLLQTICNDFGIPTSAPHTIQTLSDWLLENAKTGLRSILIIDEAQSLSFDCLEFIRLLTNLETSSRKLLQIILIGQPELEHRLAQPDLIQLQQRIFLRISLGPLSREETAAYIRHRLETSGGGNFVRFDNSAIHKLHKISGGIPRLINKISEAALRFAALENSRLITSGRIDSLPLSQLGIQKRTKIFSFFRRAQTP